MWCTVSMPVIDVWIYRILHSYNWDSIYLTSFFITWSFFPRPSPSLALISPFKLMPSTLDLKVQPYSLPAYMLPVCRTDRTPCLLPNGNDCSVSPSLRRGGVLVIYCWITSHPKTPWLQKQFIISYVSVS